MAFFAKPKVYKRTVLLVGEANFSFAVAYHTRQLLRHEHNELIATELRGDEELLRTYPQTYAANKAYLQEKGVGVVLGVNAAGLHEHEALVNRTFDEIHFNCPHDGLKEGSRTAEIIAGFFMSARLLQSTRGKILMILPRQAQERDEYRKAVIYRIYEATINAGYEMIAKNVADEKIYPEYQHVITPAETSTPAAQVLRQYIFRKTQMSRAQLLEFYHGKYGEDLVERLFELPSGDKMPGMLIKEQPTPVEPLTPLFTPSDASSAEASPGSVAKPP